MLAHDVDAARAERASQPADRRGLQELREHQAERVEHAHEQEHQRHRHLHARLVAHDVEHLEPLVDVEDAVVQLARKTPVLLLVGGVVVDEALVALAMRLRRQLHPVLQPDGFGSQQILERADLRVGARAVGVARGGQLQRFGPAPGNEEILGNVEAAVVEVVVTAAAAPRLSMHADDAVILLADREAATDAVHAAEQLVVRILRQHDRPAPGASSSARVQPPP